MKKALLSIALLACTVATNAQITLTQGSFAGAHLIGPDTLLISDAVITNPPLLPGSAGFYKDMSGFTQANNVSVDYRVAGTGTNQWADSEALSFGSYIGYKANYESSILASGYIQSGIHISRSAVGLLNAGLTGAQPTDSIVVNGQDIIFASPRKRLVLPATFKSSWTSNYVFDFNFTLTFILASYNHAPGVVRSFVIEKDSVIGYGKIQVRTKDGLNSNPTDVLQVQSTVSTRDSFYLNGTPMTPSQLALFQGAGNQFTTQGQTTLQNDVYYYRSGELTPALHVTFDSTNSYPRSAESQATRMAEFIPETEYTRTLNVYPNPVTNHTIIVSGTPANYGNWGYELQNVTGQIVTKGAVLLSANNTKTSIGLANTIAPGTYFLHLYNSTAQQTIRTLTIK
jgi:hypothetical protein